MTIRVADPVKFCSELVYKCAMEYLKCSTSRDCIPRLNSDSIPPSRFFHELGICTSPFTFFLISHSFIPFKEFSTCTVTLRSLKSDPSNRSFGCNISYNFCVLFAVLALFLNYWRTRMYLCFVFR